MASLCVAAWWQARYCLINIRVQKKETTIRWDIEKLTEAAQENKLF